MSKTPKPRVTYTQLPPESRLHTYLQDGDFCDCLLSPIGHVKRPIMELAYEALAKMPPWVRWLMQLRNAIVGLFGLKTGEGTSFGASVPENLQVGDRIGVFHIEYADAQEVILGGDDKHLDFRISLFKSKEGVILSTWVHPHNFWGKAYLTIIMPFHRLITKHTAKRLIQGQAQSAAG